MATNITDEVHQKKQTNNNSKKKKVSTEGDMNKLKTIYEKVKTECGKCSDLQQQNFQFADKYIEIIQVLRRELNRRSQDKEKLSRELIPIKEKLSEFISQHEECEKIRTKLCKIHNEKLEEISHLLGDKPMLDTKYEEINKTLSFSVYVRGECDSVRKELETSLKKYVGNVEKVAPEKVKVQKEDLRRSH